MFLEEDRGKRKHDLKVGNFSICTEGENVIREEDLCEVEKFIETTSSQSARSLSYPKSTFLRKERRQDHAGFVIPILVRKLVSWWFEDSCKAVEIF